MHVRDWGMSESILRHLSTLLFILCILRVVFNFNVLHYNDNKSESKVTFALVRFFNIIKAAIFTNVCTSLRIFIEPIVFLRLYPCNCLLNIKLFFSSLAFLQTQSSFIT